MKYYTRPLDVAITEVLALSEDGSYSLHLSTDKNQHDGDGNQDRRQRRRSHSGYMSGPTATCERSLRTIRRLKYPSA